MFSKKCLPLVVFVSVAMGGETAENPNPFKYQPESSKLLEWLVDQCSISNRMIPIGENNDPIEITLDVGLYKLMGINNREEKYVATLFLFYASFHELFCFYSLTNL